jgi:hypothetical protein
MPLLIITIYDIDTTGEVAFIAMEYVEGKTLWQLIGNKGLRLGESLRYGFSDHHWSVRSGSGGFISQIAQRFERVNPMGTNCRWGAYHWQREYRPGQRTDSSEAAPAVARCSPRGAAIAVQVCRPHRRAQRDCRYAWQPGLRGGYHSVVAVLQPGAVVRAPGRSAPDHRGAVRDLAHPPCVACHRTGTIHVLLRAGAPDPGPRLRRVGGIHPWSLGRAPAHDDGGDHSDLSWSMGVRPDRWRHQRPQARLALALVTDSRGTALGPGRQRAGRASGSSGSGDSGGDSGDSGSNSGGPACGQAGPGGA